MPQKRGCAYSNTTSSFFVGVKGFEPSTPCSQSRCANRTALRPEIECKINAFI